MRYWSLNATISALTISGIAMLFVWPGAYLAIAGGLIVVAALGYLLPRLARRR